MGENAIRLKMSKKVLLFLSEGFEAFEASAFIDVIGWSRETGFQPVDLVVAGFRAEYNCYWNLIAKPEILFDQINSDDYDALAIPGGSPAAGFFDDVYDERFLNLIREFDKQNKIIATICVAALPVGKSGVLKNRKATTWDLNDTADRRKELADFGAIVLDKQLVIDDNIITCTGPAPAIDVAFTLLEKLTSVENVKKVKRNMRFSHNNK